MTVSGAHAPIECLVHTYSDDRQRDLVAVPLSSCDVQVIGADGITPWDKGHVIGSNPDPGHYYLYVEIGPPNGDIFVVTLSQDPKTGLHEQTRVKVSERISAAEKATLSTWGTEWRGMRLHTGSPSVGDRMGHQRNRLVLSGSHMTGYAGDPPWG